MNKDYETQYVVLKHHNTAYTIDQLCYAGGPEACTVGQLINYLQGFNPNAVVAISSDHGTVGPCCIEDTVRLDGNYDEIKENNNEACC